MWYGNISSQEYTESLDKLPWMWYGNISFQEYVKPLDKFLHMWYVVCKMIETEYSYIDFDNMTVEEIEVSLQDFKRVVRKANDVAIKHMKLQEIAYRVLGDRQLKTMRGERLSLRRLQSDIL